MKISIESFKSGDYIIFTVPPFYKDDIRCPGFKEAGLLGGVILEEGVEIETWSDEDLKRVGLQRIEAGSKPVENDK